MDVPYLPFVSELSFGEHFAYRRRLAARLSLLKKSFPARESLDTREILTAHLRGAERQMLPLAREILLHDVYFSSFSEGREKASPALRRYASDAAFRYELLQTARQARDGFLCIFSDRRGDVRSEIASPPDFAFSVCPCLAVDLAEHAYFYDFGFDREKYLVEAISRLNLSLL